MSLLAKIKSLFCRKSSHCHHSEKESESSTSARTEPKSAQAAEPQATTAAEPKITPKEEQSAAVLSEPAPAPIAAETVPTPAIVVKTASVAVAAIPEDATLKRHFISTLKAEIIAGMPPRPTDSTLKRHYDATVQAELDNKLS